MVPYFKAFFQFYPILFKFNLKFDGTVQSQYLFKIYDERTNKLIIFFIKKETIYNKLPKLTNFKKLKVPNCTI